MYEYRAVEVQCLMGKMSTCLGSSGNVFQGSFFSLSSWVLKDLKCSPHPHCELSFTYKADHNLPKLRHCSGLNSSRKPHTS